MEKHNASIFRVDFSYCRLFFQDPWRRRTRSRGKTLASGSLSAAKIKPMLVTDRGDAYGCETSRLSRFLDNKFTDGGEVVSRPPFAPRKIPGTHFCYRLSEPQGHSAAGRIRSTEKSNILIGNRNRGLPACSIVPQLTTLSRKIKGNLM
jgi:hypothetical protein